MIFNTVCYYHYNTAYTTNSRRYFGYLCAGIVVLDYLSPRKPLSCVVVRAELRHSNAVSAAANVENEVLSVKAYFYAGAPEVQRFA